MTAMNVAILQCVFHISVTHTHTIAKHAQYPSLRIPNPDCETLGESEDGVIGFKDVRFKA